MPFVADIVTVPPLMPKALSLAFLRVTVISDVVAPVARMLVGLAIIVELVVLAGAIKRTELVFEAKVPFRVNESVAVRFVLLLLLVKVAV